MDRRPVRVLIADGRSHVRSALHSLLTERLGVEVVGEARDAAQALKLTGTQQPDLLLLDCELPGQNGASLLAGLQEAHPELMVIALSGRPEAREAALAAGVSGFVSKVEPPERLLTVVSDCCGAEEAEQ